jgi:hypothetical protein
VGRAHRRKLLAHGLQHVEGVHDPGDVVERAAVDRDPAVAGAGHGGPELGGRRVDVEREHLLARRHHVDRALLAELHHAGDDRQLLGLAHPLELPLAQELLDVGARLLGGGDGRRRDGAAGLVVIARLTTGPAR